VAPLDADHESHSGPGLGPPVGLRLATPADATAVAAIYAPYVTDSVISFEAEAPSPSEMAARIERVIARTPWVVAEVDGVVRAYAYGARHRERAAYDWTVETTVYVDRSFAGRGLGRTTMEALLQILRLQGAHLAVAGVTLPNPASVALHLALGFRRVGEFEAIGYKFGAWHGVEWFNLELGRRPDVPVPLVPLPELLGDPRLEAALKGA
jgi:phosphinothricin acetyltransferase